MYSALLNRFTRTPIGASVKQIGYPKTIRADQGSEFVSRDLDLWACTRGVTLDVSRPGKPTGNARIEAFNATLPGRVP